MGEGATQVGSAKSQATLISTTVKSKDSYLIGLFQLRLTWPATDVSAVKCNTLSTKGLEPIIPPGTLGSLTEAVGAVVAGGGVQPKRGEIKISIKNKRFIS